MKKKSGARRGSALILALVVAIVAAGLAGAFMAMTAKSSQTHFYMTEGDEAQQICDAGLEMARAALLKWRNQDIDTRPPSAAIPPENYAWNKVFKHCSDFELANPGLGVTANADVIKADALRRLNTTTQTTSTWRYSSDYQYNYDTTNIAQTIGAIGSGTTIGTGVSDLFCVNRRYAKGAFHIAMKNNEGDIHGNGVDNGPPFSGNPWRFDGPIPGVYAGDPTGGFPYGSGQYDPMIDGDGQSIIIVTATLPDGTQRQIEALVSFPFPGGSSGGAINANGDIVMNGAFAIMGTLGSVNANGNISGNGSANATISVSVNATGSATGFTMANTPPSGINSGTTPIPITPIDVAAFRTDSKYSQLQSNMYVFNGDGTITPPAGQPQPSGFRFNNGEWSLSGNSATPPPNAVYYFEGNFSMTGQGNAPMYNMTILATGSVELGGNSKFAPATVDGTPTGMSLGQLAIAGQDLVLRGTGQGGGVQYEGSNFANEQVMIRGNFTMNGSITAADATDSAGSSVSSSNSLGPDLTIGGNPTIIDNGTTTIVQSSADHLDLKGLHRTR